MTDAMPKEIAEAVITMMVKVGYVQKTGTNDFHKYKYAKIETLLEKAQPALTDVGLVIAQDELSHAVIADGNLMEANYAFTLHHKTGASWGPIRHTGLASVRNSKGGYDDKALNKCHTAARKYFILALLQVPTGEHADTDEQEDRPALPPQAPQRTAAPQSKTATNPAEEWAGKQTIIIRTLSSTNAVDEWIKKNEAHLARLERAAPEAAAKLDDLLAETRLKARNFGIAAE